MPKRVIRRFTKTPPPTEYNTLAYWFAFKESLLLVQEQAGVFSIPLLFSISEISTNTKIVHEQHLGVWANRHCYTVELAPDTILPDNMKWIGLRQVYGLLPDEFFSLAGEAIQILDWDRTHKFCGRCGTATISASHEYAKKCPVCGLTAYPRISPAVIMLIERDGQILLSRSPHFPKGMYSIQAGFVEPGESLEQAVEREIMEEVGIQIKHIKYFGSQPWPFPNSLMIGFTAKYASGELKIDPKEIEEAKWYDIDKLPAIPPPISIARKIIDTHLSKKQKLLANKQQAI